MTQTLFVSYLEGKTQDDCKTTAVAAFEVTPTSCSPRNEDNIDDIYEEICVLTLEKLSDCSSVGILLYSETSRGKEFEWKLMCAPTSVFNINLPNPSLQIANTSGAVIHRFDFQTLKRYIEFHTARFTKCPLCKRGMKKKKNVEEHDIDTMCQLKEKRDEVRQSDPQMCYFIESLMIRKACEENFQRPREYADIVQNCLQHWTDSHVLEQYNSNLAESLEFALKKDHALVVKKVLGYCFETEDKLRDFLVISCKAGSMDVIRLLVEKNAPISRSGDALHEAVKTENTFLIDFLIQEMKKRSSRKENPEVYILGDVFRTVIRLDLVDVSRSIIEARWYRPNDKDLDYARNLEGNVNGYLESRLSRAEFRDEDELNLDDWGDESDDNDTLKSDDLENDNT